MRRLPRSVALVAGLVGALALGGCVEVPPEFIQAEAYACPPEVCDPPIPVGPGGRVVVEAGEFFFNLVEVDAVEGEVLVELRNTGAAEHDFVIDEAFGETHVPHGRLASPGETVEAPLLLFSGTYEFYCSVPGHRQSGMFGTLVVLGPDEAPEADEPTDPEEAEEEGAAPGEPPPSPAPSPTP